MVLNLANPEKSVIPYEIYRFPDGQQQVKIKVFYGDPSKIQVIVARLNNFKDLELIVCAVASLRASGYRRLTLKVPYVLGSRSDRKFEEGSNNYMKDVLAPIINSLGFEAVAVLDPHSDVMEAVINNLSSFTSHLPLAAAMSTIGKTNPVWIAPDAGAAKKIFKYAEKAEFAGDILVCTKSRGIKGEISRVLVPDYDVSRNAIVIDDICDGGATFIGIADEIKKKQESLTSRGSLYLAVSHGIFSKGVDELLKRYSIIYTTNSYSDFTHDKVHQTNVL